MRRRDLLALLGGGAMSLPAIVRAQQKAMPVIGFLSATAPGPTAPYVTAFRQGMREAGYVEGQNLTIEYRWAEGSYDRLPVMAADLVSRKVDLIVAAGGPAPALAAKSATTTIPIIFTGVADAVELGLVASLARPGSNLTGTSLGVGDLTPKRLELLSELVPEAKVIALLVNPDNPYTEHIMGNVQEAVRAKRLELRVLKARTESEIDAAFGTLIQMQAGALVIGADPFIDGRREQIVALVARHAVPAISAFREFAASGGLISYGTSPAAVYRQVGIHAGHILNGAKPADLPVQQPTKFELVINLNTAKTLGLTLPQSLLARADEVIE